MPDSLSALLTLRLGDANTVSSAAWRVGDRIEANIHMQVFDEGGNSDDQDGWTDHYTIDTDGVLNLADAEDPITT